MRDRLVQLLRGLVPGLLAAAAPALAETEAIVLPDVQSVTTLEEIVVAGDRTLSSARQAILEAEDRFYARWNELNDDRRFHIRCHSETPRDHPSRITRRVCQPSFIAEIDQAAADRFALQILGSPGAGSTVNLQPTGGTVALLRSELKRRTLEMLDKDPELKRALLQRARLQQHFDELARKRFKDRWIVWD